MSITATNNTGTIKITAGKAFERFYSWDGATRSEILEPRRERWVGRLGIRKITNINWKPHNTITHALLEEAQLNFFSIRDALAFIRHDDRLDGNTVYNDSGLMVTWNKELDQTSATDGFLEVNVWQVLINGEKPIKLHGSQNNKILVSNPCAFELLAPHPPPYKMKLDINENTIHFLFENRELRSYLCNSLKKNTSGYKSSHHSGWNDCVMWKAVIRATGKSYHLLGGSDNSQLNCQDLADVAKREYRTLVRQPETIEECSPTQNEQNK